MNDQNSPGNHIGFKELSPVCTALAEGKTSLILRKGGIAEGRDGFHFAHEKFWLFPTFFHQESSSLKEEYRAGLGELPAPDEERQSVVIRSHVEIVKAVTLTDWNEVTALDPFHPWTEEVVRERFDYKGAGLKVALVRVANLSEPIEIPYEKALYGGCRSWVELPDSMAGSVESAEPILSDKEHERRVGEIGAVLG